MIPQLTACYIYGIIDTGRRLVLNSRAIDPRGKIYSLPYRDIGAVVSRTVYAEYDPTEENLLLHNEALREAYAMHKCVVLPMRFSTIAKSESDVMKVLVNGYLKFKQKLANLKGKVEYAVKVYCDVSALSKQTARQQLSQGEGKTLDERVRQRSYDIANDLLEVLSSLSIQNQLNDLIFDDEILNAAFLMNEANLEKFLGEISGFGQKFKDVITVKWSGPYVPYSFTDPPK